ncbi:MAG: hypothetical protein E7017_00540 [Alphaproteobacteria bacterium]|nr:hypothetical protein [Alphaproteobacteria bacterium]
MKKVSTFFAVAIIAAALSLGLPSVNFWGMVIIFLLTVLFALIPVIFTDKSMNDFGGKEFGLTVCSAIFGVCALNGLINGYDFPFWITIIMITVVMWIKPDRYMLLFAAWMTGCSATFFVQSCLHNGFILEVCVTEICIVAFVVATILSFFVKNDVKQNER